MYPSNTFSSDLQGLIDNCAATIMSDNSTSNIVSITTRIEDFPNEENNRTTTCSSIIKTNNGPEVTWCGAATDQGQGSPIALQEALVTATRAALLLSATLSSQGTTIQQQQMPPTAHHRIIDVTPIHQTHQKALDKSKFNGGGNKPATEKQLELIENLAKANNETLESATHRHFSKRPNELTGAESDSLIKQLKK